MITKAKDVDDFLNKIDKDRREDMSKLRSIIRKTIPEAREIMTYGMPTYELDGKCFVAFNSQKHYMSLYADPVSVEKNKELLKGISFGKSCIRFKSLKTLSEETIIRILKDSVTK